MLSIEYKLLENDDIYMLENMCNKLMKFQTDQASIGKDIMASMNFNNRLLADYQNASCKFVVIAHDGYDAVGFSFATVTEVTEDILQLKPAWASDLDGIGFYPSDYNVPRRIGTFKLLYVDNNYRGNDIGRGLADRTMEWLKSQPDVDDLWVFVANGNEHVGKFYEKYGFRHSHSVFNGFIHAYVNHLKSKTI